MPKLLASLLFLFCFYTSFAQAKKPAAAGGYVKPVYKELPLGSIKPQGWLLNQLRIMKNGSTGHLDEVYAKVKNDNGWLGGKGDSWEETPYWLDGALPLAYLLDDAEMKQKVLKYVNWVIDNQRPSGYFGATTKWERETGKSVDLQHCDKGEDWWPKMVMLKVLQQYYMATKDPRVLTFMSRYFNYQLQTLNNCPIGKWTEWAISRGTDNAMIAQWLYSINGDKKLLELAGLIQSQSFKWSNWFGGRDWVINAATLQNDQDWMQRHGVNVAMAVKDPAINYQRTGDKKHLANLKTGFNDLMTLHGLPYGMFSADEDLHGNDPTQGTELCAIVEAMFSLEQIIGITGNLSYMDALERMTFNALPTQTTDDYNNKQYFQVANQVQVSKGVFNFSLPFEREMNNVYGMRSGYTCCLANMHQGWTKFASHLWYAAPNNGVAAIAYSPSDVTLKVGKSNTPVTIHERTTYPFSDNINFELSAQNEVAFPFQLRIPAWCKEAIITINGKPYKKAAGGKMLTVERTWKNGDKLTLQLPMQVTTSNWGRNSRTVERGPLVYALKLEEKWETGNDEKEGEYFSVYPKGDWNFGILEAVIKSPGQHLTVAEVKPVSENFVWNLENAPIEIKTSAKKIPGWQLQNEIAPQPVTDRTGIYRGKVSPDIETITLIPYGCTKVRIVAFPVVK